MDNEGGLERRPDAADVEEAAGRQERTLGQEYLRVSPSGESVGEINPWAAHSQGRRRACSCRRMD